MTAPLASLRNLRPVTARMLREVGIGSPEALRETGAPLAYRVLCHRHGKEVNLLFLYALAGALDDRDLNSYSPEEKAALREAASGDLEVGGGETRG